MHSLIVLARDARQSRHVSEIDVWKSEADLPISS